MKTVKVSKQKLLEALFNNRKTHIKEFEEVMAVYLDKVEVELKHIWEKSKDRSNTSPVTAIYLDRPRSSEKDYDIVIGMLEMCVEDTFEITEEEYKNYVLNEWRWTESFEFAKTAYSR